MCPDKVEEVNRQRLPPAQPAFILRGHASTVQVVHFSPGNRRLLTGDADGWVISWNLSFKRPVAVWRAHSKAILGLRSWGVDLLLTHGRDNKLIVWDIGEAAEPQLDSILPIDDPQVKNRHPWITHCLTVNALNFCSFAMCSDGMPQSPISQAARNPILITVPNNADSNGIDIYHLPSEKRVAQVPASREITTGMVMALDIVAHGLKIQVAAGYESGHTAVFLQNDRGDSFQLLYAHRTHAQPVLSLCIAPSYDCYVTTSADDIIAKHPFPAGQGVLPTASKPLKILKTKHSGQQGGSIRSDGRVLATAGWDSKIRVYSAKTLKELAVLKWHREGCYATSFAHVVPEIGEDDDESREFPASDSASPKHGSQSLSTNASINDTAEESQPLSAIGSHQTTVQKRRIEKAQTTHWLAAGSKDGKVSLWDIY